MDHPVRLDIETMLLRITPAALLAMAIGFAVAQLGSPIFAPVLVPTLAAGGFAGAYLFLVRLDPAKVGLPAFDPALLAFAPQAEALEEQGSPGELLLEDELHSPEAASLAPGSNVIPLFAARPDQPQPNAVGDASGALSAALAELRRAARPASD
jgi:hypothetical protein